jgi:hypothetical protein
MSTGNGVDRDLAETTNNRLEILINTIEEANQKNDSLQQKLLWLTIVGVILAAVQVINIFIH